MKKPILVLGLLTSLIFNACDSDDNGGTKVNTPPTAVVLEIAEEDANTSVNFSWNAAVDADNDAITYDFYVNDEILATNLTIREYIWEINGEENHSYPATFKVVAKDNEGSSGDSNVVSVQDPIIGEWQLERIVSNGVEEDLTECDKLSVIEFNSDGIHDVVDRYEEGDVCETDSYSAIWENLNNGEYSFLYDGEMVEDIQTAVFNNGKVELHYSLTDGGTGEVFATGYLVYQKI